MLIDTLSQVLDHSSETILAFKHLFLGEEHRPGKLLITNQFLRQISQNAE